MNRVATFYHNLDGLVESTNTLAQLAEQTRLAACPVRPGGPLLVWLERDMLVEVVEKSVRQLAAVIHQAQAPENAKVAIEVECDNRTAFAAWLKDHATPLIYVQLSPAPTFDSSPARA